MENIPISNKVFCKFLRAKNAYGRLEGGDQMFLEIDPGTTMCWCLKTMAPVGPDEGIVHTDVCDESNAKPCFAKPI